MLMQFFGISDLRRSDTPPLSFDLEFHI
ncbi:hypothetical protein CBM2585_B80124 [Cupriavidus taiwanensis]|nr:hypothetical protein CBM2585_B80124 [Cupriavidus taiwanensis]